MQHGTQKGNTGPNYSIVYLYLVCRYLNYVVMYLRMTIVYFRKGVTFRRSFRSIENFPWKVGVSRFYRNSYQLTPIGNLCPWYGQSMYLLFGCHGNRHASLRLGSQCWSSLLGLVKQFYWLLFKTHILLK